MQQQKELMEQCLRRQNRWQSFVQLIKSEYFCDETIRRIYQEHNVVRDRDLHAGCVEEILTRVNNKHKDVSQKSFSLRSLIKVVVI